MVPTFYENLSYHFREKKWRLFFFQKDTILPKNKFPIRRNRELKTFPITRF